MARRTKYEPTADEAIAQALVEKPMAERGDDPAAAFGASTGPGGYIDQTAEAPRQADGDPGVVPCSDPAAGSADWRFDRIVPEVGYRLREPPVEVSTLRVRIDIDDARPPIWRRLDLAGDLTLDLLHIVIQASFDWEDYHLHSFIPELNGTKDRRLPPFPNDGTDEFCDETLPEERLVRLDQLVRKEGDRLFYEYDFGDSWAHTITVEMVLPRGEGDPRATLLGGRRAGPPEDVGGIWRYNEIAAFLAGKAADLDPAELDDLRELLPDDFDPDKADLDIDVDEVLQVSEAAHTFAVHLSGNPRLTPDCAGLVARAEHTGTLHLLTPLFAAADLPLSAEPPSSALGQVLGGLTDEEAEAAMTPWLTFLTTIGPDGAQLTAAGYLKPVVVETLFTALNTLNPEDAWIGKGNREDQTLPVLQLREAATTLALVRKHKGRIVPTKAAASASDPIRLWRHVAGHLTRSRHEFERHCAVLALLIIAGHADLVEASQEGSSGEFPEVQEIFREIAPMFLEAVGWSVAGRPLSGWDVWRSSTTVWTAFEHPACITPDGRVTPAGRRLARAALLAS